MLDVITIGGAVWDMLFITDKGHIIPTPENPTEQNLFAFEYGAKITSDKVYTSAGGGACNTAAGLARLGLKTAACISIGNDQNGKTIKKILEKERVNISLAEKNNNAITGFSFILVDAKDGDHTVFSYRGANSKLKTQNSKLKTAIQNSKWLYITSLSGEWKEMLKDIVKLKAQNPDLKIAFNPGAAQLASGAEGLKDILNVAEILFVNKDEAIELALSRKENSVAKNFSGIKFLMENIFRCGVKIAVITDGQNGATAGSREKIIYSPAGSKTRVDTTGAGDAFGGALLGGYILNDGNLETALKYGIINSNSVVNEYGAQKGLLKKNEIIQKLNAIKIQYLQ